MAKRKVGKEVVGFVPSTTEEGKVYRIFLDGDSTTDPCDRAFYCECGAWRYQRMRPFASVRACVHVLTFSEWVITGKVRIAGMRKVQAAWNIATATARMENAAHAAAAYNYLRQGADSSDAMIEKCDAIIAATSAIIAHEGYSRNLRTFALQRKMEALFAKMEAETKAKG